MNEFSTETEYSITDALWVLASWNLQVRATEELGYDMTTPRCMLAKTKARIFALSRGEKAVLDKTPLMGEIEWAIASQNPDGDQPPTGSDPFRMSSQRMARLKEIYGGTLIFSDLNVGGTDR